MNLLEDFVAGDGVAGNADDFDTLGGQFLVIVAKRTSLLGASAGEVGRVEVDHEDLLADMIDRLPRLALIVDAFEHGGVVAHLQFGGAGEADGGEGGQQGRDELGQLQHSFAPTTG